MPQTRCTCETGDDMNLCETIYEAAANAGFLTECRWQTQTSMVGLQNSDHSIMHKLTMSSDTTMTYPSSKFIGIRTGDRVWINYQEYQVREVLAINDGSEMRATLTKL